MKIFNLLKLAFALSFVSLLAITILGGAVVNAQERSKEAIKKVTEEVATEKEASKEREVVKKAASINFATSKAAYNVRENIAVSVAATGEGEASPTGTVTFMAGDRELGTVELGKDGSASVEAAVSKLRLKAGVYSMRAVYSGDANYEAGTSASREVAIGEQASVALTTNKDSYTRGEAVTVSVNVSGIDTELKPTGSVNIYDGDKLLGEATIGEGGIATLTIAKGLESGAHNLRASYAGDDNFLARESNTKEVNVGNATARVSVESSSDIIAVGAELTFTARATNKDSGEAITEGEVEFYANGGLIGTGTLNKDGTATLTTGKLPAGASTVTARMSGSGLYDSEGNEVEIVVGSAARISNFVSTPTAPEPGEPVTITFDVTDDYGPVAAGEVELRLGGPEGEVLGTVTVDENGKGVLNLPNGFPLGEYSIYANYLGSDIALASDFETMILGVVYELAETGTLLTSISATTAVALIATAIALPSLVVAKKSTIKAKSKNR